MKITIIANDKDVLKSVKSIKLPFIKRHPLFRILTDAITAYENKQEGQKIRAKSDDPKIELIIEDE